LADCPFAKGSPRRLSIAEMKVRESHNVLIRFPPDFRGPLGAMIGAVGGVLTGLGKRRAAVCGWGALGALPFAGLVFLELARVFGGGWFAWFVFTLGVPVAGGYAAWLAYGYFPSGSPSPSRKSLGFAPSKDTAARNVLPWWRRASPTSAKGISGRPATSPEALAGRCPDWRFESSIPNP
jgi:hypothetical protein